MALQTANQFQLVPDIGGAVGRGINTGVGIAQQQQRNTQFDQQQQALATQQGRAEEARIFQAAANEAVKAQNLPTDADRVSFLEKRIPEIVARGGDPTDSQELLDLYKSGQPERANALLDSFVKTSVQTGLIKATTPVKFSSLQQKVAAEGLDPNTPEGQKRAREITQGSRTDPSLKPSDQALINKASEGQLQSSTFANRVKASNEVLAGLEATPGFDPTSIQTAFFEAIPGGNIALSDQEQQFAQAKRDFITAVLRKESGAAIGKDEFANEDKKFFPQVGDGKAVLKQKALGRDRAFESLKKQSKGVFDVQFGQKTGGLSKAEQTELQQLREELGQ